MRFFISGTDVVYSYRRLFWQETRIVLALCREPKTIPPFFILYTRLAAFDDAGLFFHLWIPTPPAMPFKLISPLFSGKHGLIRRYPGERIGALIFAQASYMVGALSPKRSQTPKETP